MHWHDAAAFYGLHYRGALTERKAATMPFDIPDGGRWLRQLLQAAATPLPLLAIR